MQLRYRELLIRFETQGGFEGNSISDVMNCFQNGIQTDNLRKALKCVSAFELCYKNVK